MPYRVRLGPQPEAYVREKLDHIHPQARRFFEYLTASIEEGIVDLERQSEHAQSLLRKIETTAPQQLQITVAQRQAVIIDLKKTIATVPEAWVCWIEAKLPSAHTLFFSLYFEVRPPAPTIHPREVHVFKLTVHAY